MPLFRVCYAQMQKEKCALPGPPGPSRSGACHLSSATEGRDHGLVVMAAVICSLLGIVHTLFVILTNNPAREILLS